MDFDSNAISKNHEPQVGFPIIILRQFVKIKTESFGLAFLEKESHATTEKKTNFI